MTAVAPQAAARRAAGATAPQARPGTARPLLQLAPPAPRGHRGLFVTGVVAILVTGLTVLLLLHTWAAQDGFTLSALEHQQAQLAATKTSLVGQEQQLEAPARLSAAAKALGMQPMTSPRFVRLRSGRVIARGSALLPAAPAPQPAVIHKAQTAHPAAAGHPARHRHGRPAARAGSAASTRSAASPRHQPKAPAPRSKPRHGHSARPTPDRHRKAAG